MDRLDHLLRETARRRPDRIAATCGAERASFSELLRRSDAVATALKGAGVLPGDRVGVCVDKSIDCLVAVFAVLSAGAAYVPLDPTGPVDRTARIAADCGSTHVVVGARRLERAREIAAAGAALTRAIVVGGGIVEVGPFDGSSGGGRSPSVSAGAPPPIVANPASPLAYVLYTSGSTGRPKGVAVSHGAALAFVAWAAARFELTEHDVVSWHAPLQFDLSVFDVFAAVKAGARICIVPHATAAFPRSVADLLERERVTTWYSVPSALVQLVRHGRLEGRDLALRQVLFAGEPFPPHRLAELMRALPRARFFNLYGPTETNVCTCHAVAAPPRQGESVPIGRACAGDRVALLGDDGQLAKPGAIGEIAVAGPTLMDGYFGDEAATRSVLRTGVPGFEDGERVCFTGDLGRFRQDGELEFHGRRDGMVKTRGFRVELGEIEAIVQEHPGVVDAVALAVPDPEFGNLIRLVVVPRDGRGSDSDTIRSDLARFCALRLPAWMAPAWIDVAFDPLPRTATGKLDRISIGAMPARERA